MSLSPRPSRAPAVARAPVAAAVSVLLGLAACAPAQAQSAAVGPDGQEGVAAAAAAPAPASAPVIAEPATPAAALPVRTLPALSVTATRTARPLDAVPATVTVEDVRERQARGARDIKDAFRDELDVSVRQQANRYLSTGGTARAGNEGINIRGLEGNQVLILVDGIRAPSGFAFGPIATSRGDYLSLDTTRSIEVLRGPASTQYGSDGLAGVVALRTPEVDDLIRPGRSQGGYLRLGASSVDGGRQASFGLAARGERLSGLVVAGWRSGHETDNQGTVDSADASRTRPNPADLRQPSLLAKLGWQADARNTLGLTFEAMRLAVDTDVLSARGTSGATVVQSVQATDRLRRERLSLSHEHEDAAGVWFQRVVSQVHLQDARSEQRTETARTVSGTSSPLLRDPVRTLRQVGASTLFEHRPQRAADASPALPRQRLSWGADVSRTDDAATFPSVVASGKLYPDTRHTLAGLFVQDELEWGRFTLIPGLRHERYRLQPDAAGYDGTVVSSAGGAWSPRLGALWALDPAWTPYANWARGFRAPMPSQVNSGFASSTQYYTSIGNPDLKPERATSVELGLRGSGQGAAGRWRYQVSAYDNRYSDFIEQRTVGGSRTAADPLIYQYVNYNAARIRGAEARLAWDPSAAWTLKAGIARSRGHTEVDGVRTPLDSVEPQRVVLGVEHRVGPWQLRADARHVQAKARDQIASASSFATPSWSTLDLGLGWRPTEDTELQLNVQNVTDRRYWVWSDVRGVSASSTVLDAYTAPGRNVQVSLRHAF